MNTVEPTTDIARVTARAKASTTAILQVINRERIEQGMSVAAFARAAGKPQSTVSYKLKGRGRLRFSDLEAWAHALGFARFDGYSKIAAWVAEAERAADAAAPLTA